MQKHLKRLGLFAAGSVFALGTPFAVASGGRLTDAGALNAFSTFFHCNQQPHCRIQIRGVQDFPQQNAAEGHFMVSNIRLKNPQRDAVTAYAFGRGPAYTYWSGPALGIYTHYNDGRWVLTEIVQGTNPYMDSAWKNLNVQVRQ